MTQINPGKSMATDVQISLAKLPHRDGAVAGLNALFGDGHVKWQGVHANPQAFDPMWWNLIDQSRDQFAFRLVSDLWKP